MKTLLKITFLAIIAIALTRCGTLNTAALIGSAAGGKTELKSIAYDYETDLAQKSELMSACLGVGQELGYTVEDQTPELISWKVAQTNRLQEYFGKSSQTALFATVIWNEDKAKQSLRIGSYIAGNYSQAQKSTVDSLIVNFETKLRSNLGKTGHTLKKLE